MPTDAPTKARQLPTPRTENQRLIDACNAAIDQAESIEVVHEEKYHKDIGIEGAGSPWQVQRAYNGFPLNSQQASRKTLIPVLDWTEDFDTKDQYDVFVQRFAKRWIRCS